MQNDEIKKSLFPRKNSHTDRAKEGRTKEGYKKSMCSALERLGLGKPGLMVTIEATKLSMTIWIDTMFLMIFDVIYRATKRNSRIYPRSRCEIL